MITVITATYGEDVARPQVEQDIHGGQLEWLCVADREYDVAPPWNLRVWPRPHLSPRMAAHVVKCRPDIHASPESDIIVWIDASASFRRADSVVTFLAPLYTGDYVAHVATSPHPDRSSVREEWPEAAKQGRYAGQMLERQYLWYVANGYEAFDSKLFATTVMVYRRTPLARTLGNYWLKEQLRWTCQDQLSLPYVSHKTGIAVVTNEENLWKTPHIDLRPRARDI